MFKIINSSYYDENGRETLLFGIESDEYTFKDITENKKLAEELCTRCNTADLSNLHIQDVVEDFITEISYDILGEKLR